MVGSLAPCARLQARRPRQYALGAKKTTMMGCNQPASGVDRQKPLGHDQGVFESVRIGAKRTLLEPFQTETSRLIFSPIFTPLKPPQIRAFFGAYGPFLP